MAEDSAPGMGSRLKEVFTRFDKSGDGSLDMREMSKVLRSLAPSLDAQEVAAMCKELDKSNDGEVSFEEFRHWIKEGGDRAKMVSRAIKTTSEKRSAKIKETFEKFDTSGDGSLDIQEVKKVLSSLGPFSVEEVKAVCADLDKNKDGEISQKEFHDWILGKSSSLTVSKAKAFLAPTDDDGLEGAFYAFCGTGRSEMDGKGFLKALKDSRLMDRTLTSTVVDMTFTKIKPKGRTGLEYYQFEMVLDYLGETLGKDVEQMRSAIASNRPILKTHKDADVDPESGCLRRITPAPKAKRNIRAQRMRNTVKDDPNRIPDNRELYKVFDAGTPAGRILKRIYSDTSMSARANLVSAPPPKSLLRSPSPASAKAITRSSSLSSIPNESRANLFLEVQQLPWRKKVSGP